MNKGHVLVVGAAGDVGQGITSQLLSAGYHVVAAGRSSEKLEALQRRFAHIGQLAVVAGSVESEDTAAQLVARLQQTASSLQAVIVSIGGPVQEIALADLDSALMIEFLRSNLACHLVGAKAFVPLLPSGGSYLAIGGGTADLIIPRLGVVSIWQAAQRAMFKVLAEEMRARDVRIQELLLYSRIAGESNRGRHHPKWITAEEVGQHALAILEHPDWFPGPILTLMSRKEAGLRPTSSCATQ